MDVTGRGVEIPGDADPLRTALAATFPVSQVQGLPGVPQGLTPRRVLAIDPGSSESGWVLFDAIAGRPVAAGKDANPVVLVDITTNAHNADVVVIEWTSPRGMLGSLQLFEALLWAGRFMQAEYSRFSNPQPGRVQRLERGQVKAHLCGKTAAKDAMVTAALVDRFGGIGGRAAAVGVKAAPGPLFGVKADAWAALAVAVTYADDPSLVFGYETENETRLAKSAAKRAARKEAIA